MKWVEITCSLARGSRSLYRQKQQQKNDFIQFIYHAKINGKRIGQGRKNVNAKNWLIDTVVRMHISEHRSSPFNKTMQTRSVMNEMLYKIQRKITNKFSVLSSWNCRWKTRRAPPWHEVHTLNVHSIPVPLIYAHDKIGVPFDAYYLRAANNVWACEHNISCCLLTVRHSRTTLILNRDCPVDLLQFNRRLRSIRFQVNKFHERCEYLRTILIFNFSYKLHNISKLLELLIFSYTEHPMDQT